MKSLSFFFFLALFAFSLPAQNPIIKIVNTRLINNEWINYKKVEYEYDNKERERAKKSYLYNLEATEEWDLYSEVDHFYGSNDTSNYIVTRNLRSVETDDGDLNVWEEDIYEYEYDQNTNRVYSRRETTQFFPDGSTENTYGRLFSYTYTADNCKIQEIYSSYRPISGIDEWTNFYKYDYVVDDNCLVRSTTVYAWGYNNWESSQKYQYTYNENGLLINEKRFEIDGFSLILDREYSKTYDSDGRLTQYITKHPNTKNQDRIDYSYEDGFITETKYDSYDNGANWILDVVESEKNDEYGNRWYSLKIYNEDGEIYYETAYTYEYEFNNQGQLTQTRTTAQAYEYNELTIDIQSITSYTYRCDGLLKETIVRAANTNLDPCGAANSTPYKTTYFYAQPAPCETEQASLSANVFPNPAHDFILVASSLLGLPDTRVLLVDSSGKVVYDYDAYTTHKHKIHVAHLNTGLYYLRIQNQEQEVVESVFIAR